MGITRNPDGTGAIDPQDSSNPLYKARTVDVWLPLVKGIQEVIQEEQVSAPVDPDIIAPLNTIAPSFIPTSFRIGDVLTTDSIGIGTWTGTAPIDYIIEIKKNGETLTLPYTIPESDLNATYVGQVVGYNAKGFTVANTLSTSAVVPAPFAPINTVAPSFASITPVVGEVIDEAKINLGVWRGNPTPTLTYKVFKGVIQLVIPYTIPVGDVGLQYRIEVEATNGIGSPVVVSSDLSDAVTTLNVAPSIVSASVSDLSPEVGQTLSAVVSAAGNPIPDLAIQWLRYPGPVTIVGAIEPTYLVTEDDISFGLALTVIPTNSEGTGTPFTTAITAAVPIPQAAPNPTVAPAWVDNTPSIGDTITYDSVTNGTWSGYPPPTFSKQYKRNGSNINVPYTVVDADADATFICVVTATNFTSTAYTTPATVAVPAPPTTDIVPKGYAVGTTTVGAMPAHVTGDFLVGIVYKETNTKDVTMPTGHRWTLERFVENDFNAARMFSKIADHNNEGFGTSNSDLAICLNFGNVESIDGVNALSSGPTNNIGYGAPTPFTGDGLSRVLQFVGMTGLDNNVEVPPTGMVNLMSHVGASNKVAVHDTGGYVSSYAGRSSAVGGTAASYVTIAAELRKKGAPVVVDPPPPDPPPPVGATLTASGPVQSTHDGQVIQNLHIKVTGGNVDTTNINQVNNHMSITGATGWCLKITHKGVIVRHCLLEYENGAAVLIINAADVQVTDTEIIRNHNLTGLTGVPYAHRQCYGIWAQNCPDLEIGPKVKISKASCSIQASDCLRIWIHEYDSRDPRGIDERVSRVRVPGGQAWVNFLRGQHIQLNRCHGYLIEWYDGIADVNNSHTEDNTSLFGATHGTIRDSLIDGNNGRPGWAILFEAGAQRGLVERVDTVRQYNGHTNSYCTDRVTHRNNRNFDVHSLNVDNGTGRSASGWLNWGIGAGRADFFACSMHRTSNNETYNRSFADTYQMSRNDSPSIQPRARQNIKFSWTPA